MNLIIIEFDYKILDIKKSNHSYGVLFVNSENS